MMSFILTNVICVLNTFNCIILIVSSYSARVISEPEVVYNWTAQHCPNGLAHYEWDVPDAPARAYKTNEGTIRLLASVNLGSRSNWNTSLEYSQMHHDCNIYYNSTNNHNISMFSDREWIYSPYLFENTTNLYALLHMEFHGNTDTIQGCTEPHPYCRLVVITSIVSTDNGKSWHYPQQPPNHLDAAFPYKYFYNQPNFGWQSPSNIYYNSKDKYYYST
eukprot:344950_1